MDCLVVHSSLKSITDNSLHSCVANSLRTAPVTWLKTMDIRKTEAGSTETKLLVPKGDVQFEEVRASFACFKLIVQLCYLNGKFVGYSSLWMQVDGRLVRWYRKKVNKIKKRLRDRRNCIWCDCCLGDKLPFRIEGFYMNRWYRTYVKPDELCRFKKLLYLWSAKRSLSN